MRHHRRRWFAIAALVIAVVIMVSVIAVYPNLGKTSAPSPSSTSSVQTSSSATFTASDYNSSLGLRLSLSIDQNSVQQSNSLSVNVSLVNTLGANNDLAATQVGLTEFGAANQNLDPFRRLPIGVEILQGNYVLSNVSKGEPLSPYIPPASGPGTSSYRVRFAPMSGNFSFVYNQPETLPNGTVQTESALQQASTTVKYWGYWEWNGQRFFDPSTQASFHAFPPGRYTIEGKDWWGQVTIIHFKVVPNQNPLVCSKIASDPSFVKRTNSSATPGPLRLDSYYVGPSGNDTLAFALSNQGNSTVKLGNPFINDILFHGPFVFSPYNLEGRFRSYAPNGTLGYPVLIKPRECAVIVLTLVTAEVPFVGIPLNFAVDNQTQAFTLNR